MNTFKLEDVMFLWNTSEAAVGHPGKPQIAVVIHVQNNRAFDFLRKSMGACYGDWRRALPEQRASHALALFARAVGRDGVPREQAHREFMKIAEYREWVEKETGPFSDVYWNWSARAEEMA